MSVADRCGCVFGGSGQTRSENALCENLGGGTDIRGESGMNFRLPVTLCSNANPGFALTM
jgi:hypothetical protein